MDEEISFALTIPYEKIPQNIKDRFYEITGYTLPKLMRGDSVTFNCSVRNEGSFKIDWERFEFDLELLMFAYTVALEEIESLKVANRFLRKHGGEPWYWKLARWLTGDKDA